MTISEARVWLIKSSLILISLIFVFFIVSPTLGFPLSYGQSFQIIKIILPVFVSYLTTAATFFSQPEKVMKMIDDPLQPGIMLMLKGSFVVFSVMLVASAVSFYISNSPNAPPGTGIDFDTFTNITTIIISVLAGTTGVLSTFLFRR